MMKNFRALVARIFYEEIFNNYEKEVVDNTNLREQIQALQTQIAIEYAKQEEVVQEEPEKEYTLDDFCKENYELIGNIAYENKRQFKDAEISLYLNQMITPNAFEVVKMRSSIPKEDDFFNWVKKIGNTVAALLSWTDDKALNPTTKDFYLYPEESIKYKKADCEDHSFLVSSIEPKIGVAYGFYNGDNGERFGHAFNVFQTHRNLYILETTNNIGEISLAKDNKNYEIHYIITKDNTYKVKGGVSFGSIARL